MRIIYLLAAVTSCAVIIGCNRPPAVSDGTAGAEDAAPFLKASMDKYQAMTSFAAEASVSIKGSAGVPSAEETRSIKIAAPNRFSLVSKIGTDTVITISDGTRQIEFNPSQKQGSSYASADSVQMAAGAPDPSSSVTALRDPMLCGSLLYQFFGGSANLGRLAGKDRPITFGSAESVAGSSARWVNFYEPNLYGNVEALIGKDNGWVYRLKYDSEPALKNLEQKDGAHRTMQSIENYSHIEVGKSLDSAFAINVPPGIALIQKSSGPLNQAPVALGKPAPEFEVRSLNGKSVTLSSLRGKVVLVDYWATWCPPCRKGLPDTAALSQRFSDKDLVVLAVSGEARDAIKGFLAKQTYKLPAYQDVDNASGAKYNIDEIPATIIIDKQGNLSAYLLGLQEPKDVQAELGKAGLKL